MRSTLALALPIALALPAFAQDAINPETAAGALPGRGYSPYANRGFPTNVYFGDVHVHTALSADAGGGGTRLVPRDAYRFARGVKLHDAVTLRILYVVRKYCRACRVLGDRSQLLLQTVAVKNIVAQNQRD